MQDLRSRINIFIITQSYLSYNQTFERQSTRHVVKMDNGKSSKLLA